MQDNAPASDGWQVLVVDDEPAAHEATRLAIRRKTWRRRPFVLTSVSSAKEARDFLLQADHKNRFHVAIVDVVMETRFAGLDLCRFIRSELSRSVRIILRTGQPGVAQEERIINDYDVDYYLTKTEATPERLYAALRACLRSSQDIETLLAFGGQLRSFTTALQKITSREDLTRFMRIGLDFLEVKHSARLTFVSDLSKADPTPELRAIVKAHELELETGKLHPAASLGMEEPWFVLIFVTAVEGSKEAPARGGFVVQECRSIHGLQSDLGLFLQNWTIAYNNCLLHLELAEERKLLEQKVEDRTRELSDAYKNLEKLDQLKSQFFANVSHELRTPLTLSIGPLEEILQQGSPLSPSDREMYLRTIHANQLRLLKLINNLLDFSKLDAGKMTLAFQATDICKSLRFYVSTLESAAKTRRMTISLTSSADRVELYVDQDKFEKIVMNLLSNAFKFTPNGGAIHVRVRDLESTVEIDVEDTGIGVPTHALPKLFERFSQVDSSEKRAYEGTGIGLAMVKEYILLHGGEVGIQSELGRGTTFTLAFKKGKGHLDPESVLEGLAGEVEDIAAQHLVDFTNADERDSDVAEPELQAAPESGRPEHVEQELAKVELVPKPDEMCVLVVDDVADMRRFVSTLLAPHYRVAVARDGAEGLEIARRIHPDVIVSDVMMPRMTGPELCDAIKRDPGPLSQTPVILLSAKADLSKKIEGLEQGADDYLIKPFNSNELLSRVRNLVRLRHQQRELLKAFRSLEERDTVITQDLMQARDFQQSILPEPPQLPGAEVEVIYRPLDLVGGDLYDITVIDGSTFRLFLADATGHGVRAAFTTMFIKSEYEAVKRTTIAPAEVLQRLNDRMASTYGLLGMRFTAVYALVDLEKNVVRWSSAGHPGILMLKDGDVEELEGGGPFMGVVPEIEFTENEIAFGPSDGLVFYTDGIVEAFDKTGEAFGEERLVAAIRRAVQSSSASIGARVCDELDAFLGGGCHPQDDVTLLGILRGAEDGASRSTRSFRPGGADQEAETVLVELDVPCDTAGIDNARQELATALMTRYVDGELAEDMSMVVAELLENGVKYGRAGQRTVHVRAYEDSRRRLFVAVTNEFESEAGAARLKQRIDWLEGFDDPSEAFAAAMAEVLERESQDESKLGLVRIAHEGGCRLECDLSVPGKLTVRARRALPKSGA